MDLSSLTESQQQQLQQLQTQYEEHQQKRQEEAAATASASSAAAQQQQYDQSQAQSQSYYQSQPQSYDQSYYSYYQNQNPQQSQHYAAYYSNSDYANVYQTQQPQQYSQAETVPYHPPAAPPPPEAQVIEHQNQQNAYYSNTSGGTPVGQGGDQSNSGYNVPNGINAAAAQAAMAALTQLTQFAAERAMGGSQEPQWYGNGGGYGPPMGPGQFMGPYGPPVGRSSYRGGGRRGGSPFRGGRGNFSGGSGPPFRGRGRGRGRGGGPHPPHGASSSSLPDGSNSEAVQSDVGNQQPIRIAWCELCRVDCTSLEILEQHKNGKRHKKNLERLEEMKTPYKQPTNEVENDGKITKDAPDSVKQGEGENPENISTEVVTDQSQVENERQGMKRKMRGGRGGRRVKTFGGPSRRSLVPTKPKPVILICDLCNVKCDTQEVFDRHVAGKKHISKVKRFEGHQAMYGPTGVQALYPPNPMAQALSRPQVPQEDFLGGPQGSYPPPQVQNPNPQLSDVPLEFSNQNNVAQVHQPSVSVEPETKKVTSG